MSEVTTEVAGLNTEIGILEHKILQNRDETVKIAQEAYEAGKLINTYLTDEKIDVLEKNIKSLEETITIIKEKFNTKEIVESSKGSDIGKKEITKESTQQNEMND